MPDTGVQTPGTINTEAVAGNAWSNTGNITASDNTYATCAINNAVSGNADRLLLTNFDFSAIPDGATIDGIEVSLERSVAASTASILSNLWLRYNGSDHSDLKDAFEEWTTTDAASVFGGSADVWGATVTAAQVKDATFGVKIALTSFAGSPTVRLDYVTMTVHYTEAALRRSLSSRISVGLGLGLGI